MRTNEQIEYFQCKKDRMALPEVAGYEVDAIAEVFRRRNARGLEIETVPMRSLAGQRLLVKLGEWQLPQAYSRVVQSIGPIVGSERGGAR